MEVENKVIAFHVKNIISQKQKRTSPYNLWTQY